MKITIDQEKCIGCGSCQAVCSDVFEMDEDNKPHFKANKDKNKLETDEASCSKEAADICPVQAIEMDK